MKKLFLSCFAFVCAMTLVACGNSTDTSTPSTEKPAETPSTTEEKPTARETVEFWYLWGGEEGAIIEDIITAYNASQDKYEVKGLSVPDTQKIITAISGGQGPDITDNFGGNIPQYAAEQIALPLDDFIAADNLDLTDFIPAALDNQKYGGKTYGLPISVNVYGIYYNKDLFEAAGFTELPETLEELLEMATAATKVSNGNVEELGFPLLPSEWWYYGFTNAFGTTFGAADGSTITPDNEGFKQTLTALHDYVSEFGSNTVNNFLTSGNAKRYTPEDPILSGKQLFRLDGAWLGKMLDEAGVNYGVFPLPGAEAVGGEGYSVLETSNMFIPSTAKNKEGAWDFCKYITMGEGAKMFVTQKGDLPAIFSLIDDAKSMSSSPAQAEFLNILNLNKALTVPTYEKSADYTQIVKDAISNIILGDDLDSTWNTYIEQANKLK